MHSVQRPIFENRYDAGRQLAAKLTDYKKKSIVVLAIPNGGVPIAREVAMALEADLDLVVSRKIPLPLSPEGGFGAVTDDGTIILNEEAVKKTGLNPQQIDYQVSQVRADIRQPRSKRCDERQHRFAHEFQVAMPIGFKPVSVVVGFKFFQEGEQFWRESNVFRHAHP